MVDVRKDGEFLSEHVEGAIHASLEFLGSNMDRIPKDEPFYLHCAGGYRSSDRALHAEGARIPQCD